MKNYHTHTTRCNHAVGKDREYVINAINAGYEEIGFSDHAPMLFPTTYYSNFRMYPEDADDYYNSIMALKEEFKDRITIKFGFEAEYYPLIFNDFLNFIKKYDYDYLILGQHFVGNEYDDHSFYSGNRTKNENKLDRYINQVLEALKTGRFSYLAHPDLINFTGDNKIYEKKMRYLVKEVKKLGYPLEFNGLGFMQKRNYPNKIFWKIVSEEQADVVIGLDAHNPNVYLNSTTYNDILMTLKKLNIEPLNSINLIKKF